MMCLALYLYEEGSALNMSDQIEVPVALWTPLAADSSKPVFVEVGESGVVGRLHPGSLDADSCRIPRWMVERIGLDVGSWTLLTVTPLATAASVTLRAREEATLTEIAEPIETLSAALSHSWACLSVGSELPLPIGTFDIMEIRGVDGSAVPSGSILNTDVVLELIPALDHVDTPAVSPIGVVESPPAPAPPAAETKPRSGSVVGFVPFSGKGYTLKD
jgi:hypothetical protein